MHIKVLNHRQNYLKLPMTDKLTEAQNCFIKVNYMPYDYWYTPLVERDHHVDFESMPESVAAIRKLVEEHLALQQKPGMQGPKQV